MNRMAEMQKYLEKITWKVNFFSEKLEQYENVQNPEGKAQRAGDPD